MADPNGDVKKRARDAKDSGASAGGSTVMRKKFKQETKVSSAPWLSKNKKGFMCPYLDTINRKVLDFDMEKICSVSLNNFNVYACLVCGTYFQGRGKGTHAYLHSLEVDHHMFINLGNREIYCLPDNYQVHETSLEDITYNLRPTFKKSNIRRFDREGEYYHALDGSDYLIGFMGLNNIKNTDWFNVAAHALSHTPMLRDYFLFEKNYVEKVEDVERTNPRCKKALVLKFGEFIRKVWNPRGFKGHVSPHEILQAISRASGKKFGIGVRSDPLNFLSWFLNTLHMSLGGNKKKSSSIINQAFQGQVKVITDKVIKKESRKIGPGQIEIKEQIQSNIMYKKFIYLSLELPASPLFKDNMDTNFIPQVPLFDLLAKFNGINVETLRNGEKRRYQLARLPRYLIIHYKRFTSNNWFKEKNPTLVNFPLYNLDMAPYVAFPERPTEETLLSSSIKELHDIMAKNKIDKKGCLNRNDLVDKINTHYDALESKRATRYDLICNVCHDGSAKEGVFKAHIFHRGMNQWFEAEDLDIKTNETMAQQVALSECYIQVYELQPPGAKVKAEPMGNGDAMNVEASSSNAAPQGDVKVKVEETK
uniref:Ubiquitinyl hydrolase 1 n=1 Tax=Lotharella globosa TaxID=91324 RepID=A0A7S3ZCA6_9EUKA|mmetsp:Transcript_21148/g.41023  ORF Transcript_21148/g.41023 Transcript_21148/m.41023 type:complete len:592 (+) Transcript_21148:63-1838(+)|eukprot:CAMPEP_0167775744 /NCGR_PEP_ID=MMETSP0111_2-20121227/2732_1 /TAXON_ID=91324 /ORGANISM="Lotharella globosa, Strain CCCM811" /LENGTH=591 /DNA_ID=CAMNT_0007665699 /DNA_START=15 /DNA_END=1790 /DNA_ORIENTATION=+